MNNHKYFFKLSAFFFTFLIWFFSSGFDNGTVLKTKDGKKKYRIESYLGKGDFGTVYRVQPVGTKVSAPMAMKVVHDTLPKEVQNITKRGYDLYLSKCKKGCGPSIHTVSAAGDYYSVSNSRSGPFFAVLSELASEDSVRFGNFLYQRLSTDPLESIQALSIAYNELGEGILQLQEHELVLSDLKPENILLIGNRLKFADFDSLNQVKAQNPGIVTLIYAGIEYMIPEYPLPTKSDFFGLGSILSSWLLGKSAFEVYMSEYQRLNGNLPLLYQEPESQPDAQRRFRSTMIEIFTRSAAEGPLKLEGSYPVSLAPDGRLLSSAEAPPKLSLLWKDALRTAFSVRKLEIIGGAKQIQIDRFSSLYDLLTERVISLLEIRPNNRSFRRIDEEYLPNRAPFESALESYQRCQGSLEK